MNRPKLNGEAPFVHSMHGYGPFILDRPYAASIQP